MGIRHGLSKTTEYFCWLQIKARCLDPNHRAYPYYGGRGITIAPEWRHDFLAFLNHVGKRPSPKHSLDRRDNNKGYFPGNIFWVLWDKQAKNRRPIGTAGVSLREPDHNRRTNFKHGMINSPEYNTWSSMKDRCLNPKSSNYPYWGGRGITIYEPWIHDFMAFFKYIGPRPSSKHSIDRINNDLGYFPGNIRWADSKTQRANQRPYTTGPEHGNYEHGGSKTSEYKTWGSIKTRCFNPKHDRYCDYGAKSITMCRGWKDSFEAFLEDLGKKPTPKHTVHRIDHDGNYSCGKCPECLSKGWAANCRWASKTEENRARRLSSRSGKLNEEKVELIRKMIAQGVGYKVITKKFGIGHSLVGKIKRYENWI